MHHFRQSDQGAVLNNRSICSQDSIHFTTVGVNASPLTQLVDEGEGASNCIIIVLWAG